MGFLNRAIEFPGRVLCKNMCFSLWNIWLVDVKHFVAWKNYSFDKHVIKNYCFWLIFLKTSRKYIVLPYEWNIFFFSYEPMKHLKARELTSGSAMTFDAELSR